MHVLTMNTLQFPRCTEEAAITASSSMVSGKGMRLCKVSKLVLAQKTPTSREHC